VQIDDVVRADQASGVPEEERRERAAPAKQDGRTNDGDAVDHFAGR
jgi:hypothetical protein